MVGVRGAGLALAGPSQVVAVKQERGKIRPDAPLHWSFTFHLKMVGNIEIYL